MRERESLRDDSTSIGWLGDEEESALNKMMRNAIRKYFTHVVIFTPFAYHVKNLNLFKSNATIR
jgi:hypothetical protein